MIDIAEELYKFNPWWEEDFQPNLIERPTYINFLKDNLHSQDIIIVTGLRRVGKTSLMKMFICELLKTIEQHFIFYASLDSLVLERYPISEIIREYRKIHDIRLRDKIYLFLDEIAYRENVHQEMKNLYDIENVKIVASSSSTSILRDSHAFLTGRCRICEVLPLDFNEFLQFKGLKPKISEKYLLESLFEKFMNMGGIPEYILTDDISYLDNLITDILYKDIIAYHKIKDVQVIKDMFCLLMERAGKQISINRISKVLGSSPDTISRYLHCFLETYLIYTIERHGKINERLRSPKKLFAADVGIRNHITGFRDKGSVFENLIFLKIKHRQPYYVYQDGTELDFLMGDTLIEVKYQREPEGKQKALFENFKIDKKLLIKDLDDYLSL